MSIDPDHLEALFARAVDLPSPAERPAFLDAACAGDAALRQRLDALLRAYDAVGDSFLQRTQAELGATVAAAEPCEGPGAVIGPYKLLEQIGEGGFGIVFLAEQTQPIRRRVAVKVLKPGMDTRQVVARFEAERQALAIMDHLHIAKVLDGGVAPSGRPFFVMELVRGVPITDFCDEHRLTPRQRLELFVPVCAAIQHAHTKGIIHRDIKPSNVLVALYDDRPVPKVIDFGVAKATGLQLTEETLHTGFGAVVGTFEYMSPEQASFNALDVDTRSDIYSLGVLLYELLVGSPPFSRKELENAGMLEMLRLIREQEPSKPSAKLSTVADLPALAANRGTEPKRLKALVRGELDWIVMMALEKDRNRRYETANSFAQDVRRYLGNEPVHACPPSLGYLVRKFVSRHKGPVLAASLVVLALLIGIIGTTWGLVRATDEAELKKGALGAAQASEQDAKDKLRSSLYERARAGRFSRQMGQRIDSLAALTQAARLRPDEQLRDEAIAAMALPDIRRGPAWHAIPLGTNALGLGREYRLYARADAQGTISICTIPGDEVVRRIESGPIISDSLGFSPNERFLLGVGERGTLRLWRVADGQPVLQSQHSGYYGHAFSPDGQRLAVGQNGEVLCFDLATGQEVKRWRLPTRAHRMAFHPDNNQLAVGYFSSDVVSVCDAASGALLTNLPVGKMDYQVLAWHPDGQRLAVAGSDPRIQLWDVAARRRLALLEGHVQNVTHLTFHPEGELLASDSWDGVLRLWHPSSGRQLMQLPTNNWTGFSNDGRWLGAALSGEQAQLLEVVPTREYRTLVSSVGAGRGGFYYGDISPDGRLLAVAMAEGARLWDLRFGRELAALPNGSISAFFDGRGAWPSPPSQARLGTSPTPGASLLTSGDDGLLRWPITSDDPEGKHLRLGPPQQLSPLPRAWFTRGPDGHTLGAATVYSGVNKILDLSTGTVRRDLGVHPDGEVHALSADGRWAASCGWHSDRVRLWNVATGQVTHEWPLSGPRALVFFTPDSRVLIIARGEEFSFWDVETRQLIRRLPRDVAHYPGRVAFSPDGRLMALEMAPGVMHLKDVATARTVAKLEDPHGDRTTWQAFTPDGTQLVVVALYAHAIHVWDLRAIRARLKEMNLDWEWPEFPPAPAAPSQPVSAVTVDFGYLQHALDFPDPRPAAALFSVSLALQPLNGEAYLQRGLACGRLKLPQQAVADYSAFLVLASPEHPRRAEILFRRASNAQQMGDPAAELADLLALTALDLRNFPWRGPLASRCNAVAWGLVAGPEKERQADRAVALARKAVELAPGDGMYRNTLGVAYYRTDRWRDAVTALEANLSNNAAFAAFDLYFLAMSCRKLDEPAKARDHFDRAVRWQQEKAAGLSPAHRAELDGFRTEAAALLGVDR